MKVLPLLAAVYAVGVLLILKDAPQGPWTHGQTLWMNLGAFGLIAFGLVCGIIAGIRKVPENYRVSALAVCLLAISAAWVFRADIADRFAFAPIRSAPLAAVADTTPSTALPRRWDGHFRALAQLNGGTVEMLVDTGASVVLLRHEDAVAAGIDIDALEFNVPILTANGKSHVAAITLPLVDIGGVAVRNVSAAVAEPGQLHASLLGMSYLGEIEEAVIRKDRLILRN